MTLSNNEIAYCRAEEQIDAICKQAAVDMGVLGNLLEGFRLDDDAKTELERAIGRRFVSDCLSIGRKYGDENMRKICFVFSHRLDCPPFLFSHLEAISSHQV